MITELDYNNLIDYAKKICKMSEVLDFVHDGIAMSKTNCIDDIKKEIRNAYYSSLRKNNTEVSYNDLRKNDNTFDNHKFCKKCNEVKPLDFFNVRIDKKTGFKYRWYCCKQCRYEQHKKWREGKQLKYNKARNEKYKTDPEYRKRVKINLKIWSIKNPDKVKAMNKRKNDKKKQRVSAFL